MKKGVIAQATSSSVNASVSVLFYFDGEEQYARPVRLLWRDKEYELGTVQFWYATHHGDTLMHHYTLNDAAGTVSFQLVLETENLTWRLQQATPLTTADVQPQYSLRHLNKLVGAMG